MLYVGSLFNRRRIDDLMRGFAETAAESPCGAPRPGRRQPDLTADRSERLARDARHCRSVHVAQLRGRRGSDRGCTRRRGCSRFCRTTKASACRRSRPSRTACPSCCSIPPSAARSTATGALLVPAGAERNRRRARAPAHGSRARTPPCWRPAGPG